MCDDEIIWVEEKSGGYTFRYQAHRDPPSILKSITNMSIYFVPTHAGKEIVNPFAGMLPMFIHESELVKKAMNKKEVS